MKYLLNALQEGRFVELPETNKDKALNYLANLIEAMPELPPGTDVAGAVLAREGQFNTGIGMGWACPHMRTAHESDMICAAGWSPAGIEYGSADQRPVHFVVMYYVPDSEKHVYLKEISGLVKAIQRKQAEQDLGKLQTLAQARDWVLDLVSTAVESQMSDVKARMIHLEARTAAAGATPADSAFPYIIPLSILVAPGSKAVVLSLDLDATNKLESAGEIDQNLLAKQAPFEHGGYKLMVRSVAGYQMKRIVYDCLAFKLPAAPEKPKV